MTKAFLQPPTTRPSSRWLAPTLRQFQDWLRAAQPGARLVYWVAWGGAGLPQTDVVMQARVACAAGDVVLAQLRDCPEGVARTLYFAVRTGREAV